jgi:hypothetical protein
LARAPVNETVRQGDDRDIGPVCTRNRAGRYCRRYRGKGKRTISLSLGLCFLYYEHNGNVCGIATGAAPARIATGKPGEGEWFPKHRHIF